MLTRLGGHASVSGAVPSDVAGHPAYTVTVSPRANGGLVGGASLAFDAARGVPLRFALYARGDRTPVLELKATNISYGSVAPSVFSLTPPRGAKVVNVDLPSSAAKGSETAASDKGTKAKSKDKHRGRRPRGASAPELPAGGPRRGGQHVAELGHPAGQGRSCRRDGRLRPGSRWYLRDRAPGASTKLPSASGDQRGLSLPTVSINGASAQELATPLGTVLRFSRGGVSYTLFGSVTSATAERAARSL